MRTPTLVGARVPRARRHPTPTRGSVVGRPAAFRAGGGPPGTSAPTILPPAPAWPLPLSHPHPLGPYHCPTRTRLAPTILPPAPAWPLPLSHPHQLGPYHSFSRPHPLGPDVGSTTARRAKYPRRPRRGASTLSHLMRPSHARPVRRETPPKKSDFFCHRRMPVAYIHVSGFARICAAPNKTRGIRRFGRRVRRVYFFSRPPCAHGGCVVYSWRL